MGRRAVSLERVDPDLVRRVQIISRLREKRWNMTRRAFRLAIEECLSSLECDLIVRASRRHRCWDRELVEMKRGQFRCQFVRCTAHVSGPAFRGDWILIFVVEASVEESPGGMHLAYANISVPVRNRSKTGPSVQVHAG